MCQTCRVIRRQINALPTLWLPCGTETKKSFLTVWRAILAYLWNLKRLAARPYFIRQARKVTKWKKRLFNNQTIYYRRKTLKAWEKLKKVNFIRSFKRRIVGLDNSFFFYFHESNTLYLLFRPNILWFKGNKDCNDEHDSNNGNDNNNGIDKNCVDYNDDGNNRSDDDNNRSRPQQYSITMINAFSFLPLLCFLKLNVTDLRACKNIAAAAADIDLQKGKKPFNASTFLGCLIKLH